MAKKKPSATPEADAMVVKMADIADIFRRAETQTEASKGVDKVDIRTHDGPMMIPEGMTTEQAITALQRKAAYDDQDFRLYAEFDCFVYEAAYALSAVLGEMFGWAGAETAVHDGMFGKVEVPPVMLSVPVDAGRVVEVPWGRFKVPGVEGYIECGATWKAAGHGAVQVFTLQGQVKRRDEAKVQAIVEAMRTRIATQALYKGKVFRLALKDDYGEPHERPVIDFPVIDPAIADDLVLSRRTASAVTVNLFTPIERTADVRAAGVPLKRGILLAGPYGTGKTMIATVTALKARAAGWTYIVCQNPPELADVLRIARAYQPAVVFAEDIDRVASGDRDEAMDHTLNVIDGVESKAAELMIVLTTNELDRINPALLRPGRLDAIITVDAPDAEAAELLARRYARGLIPADERLVDAPPLLAGKISSVIREVVERAKLAAIALGEPGGPVRITDAALVAAARDMDAHIAAATPRAEDRRSEIVKAAAILSRAMDGTSADKEVPA